MRASSHRTAILLAPLGIVVGHELGYVIAHPDAAGRAEALSSYHGHFALLLALAVPALLLVLGEALFAGWRGRDIEIHGGSVLAYQASGFLGMEVVERMANGGTISHAFHEPAVWIGVLLQVLIAFTSVRLVRASRELGATLARPDARPIHRPAGSVLTGRIAAPRLSRADRTPLAERAPPLLLPT